MKIIYILFITILWALVSHSQNPGTPDKSFGNNGIVKTNIGGGNAIALTMAIQNDDKIIVAGKASVDMSDDIALVRYDIDGSVDNSFGKKGFVITSIGNVSDVTNAIILQYDGKIITAGSTTTIYGNRDFALVRYTPDGRLDTTFGNQGIVISSVGKKSI